MHFMIFQVLDLQFFHRNKLFCEKITFEKITQYLSREIILLEHKLDAMWINHRRGNIC